MSYISVNQNQRENIDRLASQRYFYSVGKKLHNSRLLISIFFAIFTPLLVILYPSTKITAGVMSSLWVIASFILQNIEKKIVNLAVNIQEEIDTGLFRMSWNYALAGEKPSEESIIYGSKKFEGDMELLKDWYGDVSGFPYPLDVLLCQRSNLAWDWRLKRIFSLLLSLIILIFFLSTIIIGIKFGLTVYDFILVLVLPCIPSYVMGIQEARDFNSDSINRAGLETKISKLSESVLVNDHNLQIDELRNIQDSIYIYRKGPLVPDWVFYILRNFFENTMQNSLNTFKEKYLSIKK
ncbi:hypothetical protein KBD69_04235 [Candidatus Woesebacteria bacterium]|nr:hypothetical protein [Candidatus Woesebacteria bacterium]